MIAKLKIPRFPSEADEAQWRVDHRDEVAKPFEEVVADGRLQTGVCVRLAAPEPEVLKAIGEESKSRGTDKLSSRRIDQVIAAARARKPKPG